MKLLNVRGVGAVGGALMALLVFAPAALADSVVYNVPASPAYTVRDSGQGIVKVTYNGCVTAGAVQTFGFQALSELQGGNKKAGIATWQVLRAEGENPQFSFSPATLFLAPGPAQVHNVTLSYTLTEENNNLTSFRIKLEPAPGQGLGQSAGILVSIPCVAPATSIPSIGSLGTGSRGDAPCIRIRRMTLRVGRWSRVVANVERNGQPVIGALVRATGPGIREEKLTNGRGKAVFKFTPRRRGTLVVQSNVCSGADRLAIGDAAIRFTG